MTGETRPLRLGDFVAMRAPFAAANNSPAIQASCAEPGKPVGIVGWLAMMPFMMPASEKLILEAGPRSGSAADIEAICEAVVVGSLGKHGKLQPAAGAAPATSKGVSKPILMSV